MCTVPLSKHFISHIGDYIVLRRLTYCHIEFLFHRLGHGDFVKEGDISSPTRVPLFHMLNICVEAVACGGQHTLAITHQGVSH